MKALVVIAAIAGAIRLATVVDPTVTAGVVGVLVLIATGYGLWSNGRAHWHGWLTSWGLISLGLVGNVLGSVIEGGNAGNFAKPGLLPLGFTLGGETLAIAGLLLLLHHRLPGRSTESLATATVSIMALMVPLLALVVTPAIGWHPGTELSTMAVPLLALVMLWLGGSITSLSSRNPVAYRYLLAGFACLFAAHAAAAALFLAGMTWSPVPLSAVVLWSLCLWSCAVLHPSQRQALEPIPFRSTRLGWAQISLILVAALIAPAVLAVKAVLHAPGSIALLAASAAVLPVLVVMYLLYQVFARSAAEYRAQHDPLTGVCNRVLFNDNLEAALLEADRSAGGSVAVMFLDLDRFKTINDSLGHAIGNQVLQAVVQRLQSRLRPTDILARMGGDEFTILMREVSDKANAANFAERILAAFVEPFNVGGKLMPVQTSIGVAMYPEDGPDGETLLKNADTAMYQAKAAGRNTYTVYNSAMSARAELRFVLENSLRGALDRGQLAVHYQPKFSTVGAQIKGVEALARWHHPRLGFIPPSAFIPLAEETSLISSLGEWVLESACLQAKAWQESGMADLPVAVNISPRQFVRQSVVRMVDGVLRRTGLDPTLLELEVTESVLIEHVHDTATSLAELRSMGVRCSIDDFGTGYSALTYLTDMPVDALKIDPSFVRKIDSETGAAPIVGAVIALAHSLGLGVVAEGVETETQLNFLAQHGCDMVQGYLFSPPVPADQIPAFISNPPELLVAERDNLKALSNGSPLLPPTKLAAILAGVSPNGIWPEELDRDDFMAVLAALQDDDIIPIVGPRGLRLVPARMAIGTLAGLASLTGGLSAAGELPGPLQRVATDLLQQAVGIVPPPVPSDGRSQTLLLSDPTIAQIQSHLVVSQVQSPGYQHSNGVPDADALMRTGSPSGDENLLIDNGSDGQPAYVGSPGSGTSATGGGVGGTSEATGSTSPAAGGTGNATSAGGTTSTSTGTVSGGSTTGAGTGGVTGGGSSSGTGDHSPGSSGSGNGGSVGNGGSSGGGSNTSPGNSANAPGHTGNTGNTGSGNAGNPGNDGNTNPGNGGNSGPGNSGPGNSANAPGHTGNTGNGNTGNGNTGSGNAGNPGNDGNTNPGNGGNSGSGNTSPGNSANAPGHTGNTGNGNTGNTGSGNAGNPGNDGNTNPGNGGNSGSGNTNPGNSANAPGHTGNTGNGNTGNTGSGNAGNPGNDGNTNPGNGGNSGSGNTSPGNSANAPGHTGNTGNGNIGNTGSGNAGGSGNGGSSNSGPGNGGNTNPGNGDASGSGNAGGSGNTGSGNAGGSGNTGSGNVGGSGNTGSGNVGGSGNTGSGNVGGSGNTGSGSASPGNSAHSGDPGNSGNAPGDSHSHGRF